MRSLNLRSEISPFKVYFLSILLPHKLQTQITRERLISEEILTKNNYNHATFKFSCIWKKKYEIGQRDQKLRPFCGMQLGFNFKKLDLLTIFGDTALQKISNISTKIVDEDLWSLAFD